MGRFKLLFTVLCFAGCANSSSDEDTVRDVQLDPVVIDSGNVGVDSNSIKYAWLDSLQSDNASVRLAAFKQYRHARPSSDGDASEMLSAYLKTYVYSHPKEFLSSYSFMSPAERVTAQTDIAYQIYESSNKEYQRDIDEYFSEMSKSCTDCSADLKKLLADFKKKVEVRAKQLDK